MSVGLPVVYGHSYSIGLSSNDRWWRPAKPKILMAGPSAESLLTPLQS